MVCLFRLMEGPGQDGPSAGGRALSMLFPTSIGGTAVEIVLYVLYDILYYALGEWPRGRDAVQCQCRLRELRVGWTLFSGGGDGGGGGGSC
jgi:hypothetical protein